MKTFGILDYLQPLEFRLAFGNTDLNANQEEVKNGFSR